MIITSVMFVNAQSINDESQLNDLTKSISLAVNTRNPQMILDAFAHPSALIYDLYNGQHMGIYSEDQNTAQGLANFVKSFEKEVKQFTNSIEVKMISKGRATVSNYYKVTIDGKPSHQGEEFYTAIKTKKGWKFISLMFTLELPSKN